MTQVKISQLPQASLPLTGAEIMPVVQSGVTVKAPVGNVSARTASFTSLRGLSPANYSALYVEGYSSVGDGGGGSFYTVTGAAPGTYIDNDGTIIVPSGGNGSAAFLRVIDGPYNVKWFGAKGDNVTNDSPAFIATHAALPATGGSIYVPDSTGYVLNSSVVCTKPVAWVIGVTTITCPLVGWAIEITANGSSVRGAGRYSTTFVLRTPTVPVTSAVATAVLTAGVVTSVSIGSGGSGYYTKPLVIVSDSPTKNSACVTAILTAGVVTGFEINAGGSGYVTPPTLTFIGGGAGAVKSTEVQSVFVGDFSIDMGLVANATGVLQYGGWYAEFNNVEVKYSTEAATACGFVIDSHSLGVPGPTGSYGGAYVNRYVNTRANRWFVTGTISAPTTTFLFDTVDTQEMFISSSFAHVFTNPVIQNPPYGAFLDLASVGSLTILGGDFEGIGDIFRLRGSVNNVLVDNLTIGATTGDIANGTIGEGWYLKFTETEGEILYTGVDNVFRRVGWVQTGRLGHSYAGNVFQLSNNLKMLSASTGDLDDTSQPGGVIIIDGSGSVTVKFATAGSNPRTLSTAADFNAGGVATISGAIAFPNLPAAPGSAGSKQLWYDPSDGNRVKFTP